MKNKITIKKYLTEAPTFSRVVGKFNDYTSKVINILKRNGVDEREDLNLSLITQCYSQNDTATVCARGYLKVRETKQKQMTENYKKQIVKDTLVKLKSKGLINEKAISKYLKEDEFYSELDLNEKYLATIREHGVTDEQIIDEFMAKLGTNKAKEVLIKIARDYDFSLEGEDEDL